jgi:hypothetical protein
MEDESHDLDLVTVFQGAGAYGEMEALSVQTMLKASGFDAVIVGDSRFPNFPEEVRVPRNEAAAAEKLIHQAKASRKKDQ